MCTLDEMREDRIPPSAPAFDTSGGTITSSPGSATNRSSFDSTAVPARMSSSGVKAMAAAISTWMRRAMVRSVRAPRIVAYRETAIIATATTAFSQWTWTMNVARYSDGTVVMSPAAVTIGVPTASRS